MKLFVVPVLLALSGCTASPAGPASFEAEYAPAGVTFAAAPALGRAGGLEDLALANGADRPIGYNLCFAAFEQFQGGLWIPARSHAVSCPRGFASLAPGTTATGQAVLPASLEPGLYRIVTQLSASSENLPDVQLRGEPFRVD